MAARDLESDQRRSPATCTPKIKLCNEQAKSDPGACGADSCGGLGPQIRVRMISAPAAAASGAKARGFSTRTRTRVTR